MKTHKDDYNARLEAEQPWRRIENALWHNRLWWDVSPRSIRREMVRYEEMPNSGYARPPNRMVVNIVNRLSNCGYEGPFAVRVGRRSGKRRVENGFAPGLRPRIGHLRVDGDSEEGSCWE